MKRKVNIGTRRYTAVNSLDDVGAGGAHHEYEVVSVEDNRSLTEVSFQNGPIKENGVNGCHNEDLIAIVLDRLECFQAGKFKCYENNEAIESLQKALKWLRKRTDERIERGVEGTSTK